MYLAQLPVPGKWHLFTYDHQPVFPVPGWLIEATGGPTQELAHALATIYGQGRRLGQEEGRDEIRSSLKSILQIT